MKAKTHSGLYSKNIEQLHVTLLTAETSATLSVIFHFARKNAGQESSKFSETQAAWNLPSTTVSTVASAVTMLSKLSSYVIHSTSERVALIFGYH